MSLDPRSEEEQFFATYRADDYERPSVAVDVVLITWLEDALQAVVVKRVEHPYREHWVLPGGFVALDESLDEAARRVLSAKARLGPIYLEQLASFGDPARDPRMRIISVAYYALVDASQLASKEGPWQLAQIYTPWRGEAGGAVQLLIDGQQIPVGFDHAQVIGTAIKRLRGKLNYAPVAQALLPRAFTLSQLQQVHEAIEGHSLNKDSFRRRLLASGSIEPTGNQEAGVIHRPAMLYRTRVASD
jgi:8-oxo-dGTP diphosphatase